MKYLPINLDQSDYLDLQPRKDWFEEGDKNKCKTIDAKLLMELYKRVNHDIFGSIVSLTDMLNYPEESGWTFEKAFESLKKDLEQSIQINQKALAKELILKDKNQVSPYYVYGYFDHEEYFAFYSASQLVDMPD